jgi:hypothetical protein
MRLLVALLLVVPAFGLTAADPVDFAVGGFTFERPTGWRWVPPTSPMRKAQLAVAGSGGDEAEVTFFCFGAGQGGGVKANIDRWFGQFENAGTSTREEVVGTTRVVFAEAAGTFLSGMPGGQATPKDGYALRGAILPHKDGDVFVKMTGPAATVAAADPAFAAMIRAAAGR